MDLPRPIGRRCADRPTLRLDSSGQTGRRGGGRDRTTNGSGTLDIGLLGPVRVLRDGVPVEIGGSQPQTLLAMLALRAGSPVSLDALTDELWAGEPPAGSPATLRSYVSRLRTALGDVASIERQSTGYVLGVPRDWVDVVRFDAGVRLGRQLLDGGRSRRAATVLRETLGLWRGLPFTGLPSEGSFRAEAVRLEELRLHALESRIEADLASGHADEVVDELEALLVEHPFRERLWQHLMLALYRAGRQADALAAYHRAREALDEQLGIEPGAELQELEAAILRQDVPRTADRRQPMLGVPAPLTSFVGRSSEVREIVALLKRVRLVTLVGVGGVGKTRLSIEAARRALDEVVDGVAFVDLAALADPEHLAAQVAASLGIPEGPAEQFGGALAEHLGSTSLLLVLDNCEHLREAAAALAHDLLRASPDVRILATSREVLDIGGEATYQVSPLDEDDAVRLLFDRATLTRHGLRVDEDAMATGARICRDLDGLPLAIELAAARTRALSLEEVAGRLQDRFRFLVAWRRLSSARHRTLREAMDWSYELLAPDEQRLLARLSVFPAGASLDSIAAVALDDDRDEAERLLERLVDASLVVPVQHELGTRYRLLETVREYSAELLPPEELAELQRRHARHTVEVAESMNLGLEGRSHAGRFDLARLELPAIRAAIQWATEHDLPTAVAIASSLERFWAFTQPREGIAIFNGLLDHPVSDADRARILRCRGGARYASADFAGGAEDYEQALAIHRRLGDRAHQAHLLMRLAVEAQRTRDHSLARRLLDDAAAIGGADRFGPDLYVGLEIEADLAFDEGREDDAYAMFEQAHQRATDAGDVVWQLDSLQAIADRASDRGRRDLAARAGREALALAREIQIRPSLIWGLAILARLAAEGASHRRAGRLWGGLEAEVERGGPVGQWELEAEARRAHVATLGGPEFEAGVDEGRSLSLDAAVDEALREA